MEKDQHHHSTSPIKHLKDNKYLPIIPTIQKNFKEQIAYRFIKFNPKNLCHENQL